MKIPLDDIAVIRGTAGSAAGATAPRVYLRSGEIYSGRVVAGDLRFVGPSGIDVKLSFDQLDAVVMRSAENEKKLEAPTVALITTLHGDRLAVASTPAATLQFATPWSTAKVAVDQIQQLTAVTKPQPTFRLNTIAGDQLTILIKSRELTLNAARFESVQIAVRSIQQWQAVDPRLGLDLFPARLHLSEGNTVAGAITPGAIRLSTAAGDVTIPSENIASIAPQTGAAAGTIQVTPQQGEPVVGRCIDPTLEFQAFGTTWRVPIRHLQGFQAPNLAPKKASSAPASAPVAPRVNRSSPKPEDLFADPFGGGAANDPFGNDPFN